MTSAGILNFICCQHPVTHKTLVTRKEHRNASSLTSVMCTHSRADPEIPPLAKTPETRNSKNEKRRGTGVHRCVHMGTWNSHAQSRGTCMGWEGRAGAGPDARNTLLSIYQMGKGQPFVPLCMLQLLLYQRLVKESACYGSG